MIQKINLSFFFLILCVSRSLLAYKKAVLPTVSVIYYCVTFSSSNNLYV